MKASFTCGLKCSYPVLRVEQLQLLYYLDLDLVLFKSFKKSKHDQFIDMALNMDKVQGNAHTGNSDINKKKT